MTTTKKSMLRGCSTHDTIKEKGQVSFLHISALLRSFRFAASQSRTMCLVSLADILHYYHYFPCSPPIQAVPWAFEVFHLFVYQMALFLYFFARTIHGDERRVGIITNNRQTQRWGRQTLGGTGSLAGRFFYFYFFLITSVLRINPHF